MNGYHIFTIITHETCSRREGSIEDYKLDSTNTISQIEQIRFDAAFLGTCSICPDGIYIGEHEDAAIKRKVAEHSGLVYVIADHSKFNTQGNFRCISLDKIDTLFTNQKPPKELMQSLDKNGVSVEIIKE